jgi:hypothetical protein
MRTPRENQPLRDFAHSVDVLIASAFAGRPPPKRAAENPNDAAIARALPSPSHAANDDVVFLFEAAATGSAVQAIVSESDCRLWTLEIFVGTSPRDRAEERGSLLLAVSAENRDAYEGCTASIYAGSNTLFAKGVIINGELFSEVSLRGLDLQKVDKVWVKFGPQACPP